MMLAALFGGIGATMRWWLSDRVGRGSIWATAVINVVGAFLLGLVIALVPPEPLDEIALAFFGAFTTYSAFAGHVVEGWHPTDVARRRRVIAYVAVTLVVGLAAAKAGIELGHNIRPD